MIDASGETERSLRRELVQFSRRLSNLGFTPGTSGNLSVRLDQNRLLITPTGMSKYMLRSPDMVIVDLHGRLLAGTRKVTSEAGMHLAIYRLRSDVQAVVHCHPPNATAFACCGRALDEILCQEAVMTLGIVPLAAYATTGTAEVAASLNPLIPGHQAILMANHGAVSYGATLLEAFQRMETVEHLAHVELIAHQLGSAMPLCAARVQELNRARASYARNSCPGNVEDQHANAAPSNGFEHLPALSRAE